jgi:hypothetical protein
LRIDYTDFVFGFLHIKLWVKNGGIHHPAFPEKSVKTKKRLTQLNIFRVNLFFTFDNQHFTKNRILSDLKTITRIGGINLKKSSIQKPE